MEKGAGILYYESGRIVRQNACVVNIKMPAYSMPHGESADHDRTATTTAPRPG